MSLLVNAYKSLGRLGQAEALARDLLGIRNRVLGPDHPDTLNSMEELALIEQLQGRSAEAESLERQALVGATRALGPVHPLTLTRSDGLGGILLEEGKYADAEPILRQSLVGRLKAGPAQWGASATRVMLGQALLGERRFVEAETQLLEGYEGLSSQVQRIPELNRPVICDACKALIELYRSLGQPEKRETWEKRLLDSRSGR